MNSSTDLLDSFTQILAYLGDENAKDGYFLRRNNAGNPTYSINIRKQPLVDLQSLIIQIKTFLENGTPLEHTPNDVSHKVDKLKEIFDKSEDSSKAELLQYISDYEVYPMHGGSRRKSIKRLRQLKQSKQLKQSRRNRNNRKTQRNRQ